MGLRAQTSKISEYGFTSGQGQLIRHLQSTLPAMDLEGLVNLGETHNLQKIVVAGLKTPLSLGQLDMICRYAIGAPNRPSFMAPIRISLSLPLEIQIHSHEEHNTV